MLNNSKNVEVVCFAISSTEKMYVAGCSDGNLRVYDMAGDLLHILKSHLDKVTCVGLQPTSGWCLSGSDDSSICIWDSTWKRLNRIRIRNPVMRLEISPNGEWFLTQDSSNLIEIRAFDGSVLKALNDHKELITSMAFSPNGKWFATSFSKEIVSLWNCSGNHLATLEAHSQAINCVAIDSQGRWMLTGSDDQTLCMWNSEGKYICKIWGHTSPIKCVEIAHSGKWFISGANNGDGYTEILRWNSNAKVEHKLGGGEDGPHGLILDLKIARNEQFIIGVFSSGSIHAWNSKLVEFWKIEDVGASQIFISRNSKWMVSLIRSQCESQKHQQNLHIVHCDVNSKGWFKDLYYSIDRKRRRERGDPKFIEMCGEPELKRSKVNEDIEPKFNGLFFPLYFEPFLCPDFS